MTTKLTGDNLHKLNRLTNSEPTQHGTPPPSDQTTAESHPTSCKCCACWDSQHPESEDNDEQNNALWESSILNENTD